MSEPLAAIVDMELHLRILSLPRVELLEAKTKFLRYKFSCRPGYDAGAKGKKTFGRTAMSFQPRILFTLGVMVVAVYAVFTSKDWPLGTGLFP